MKPFYRARTVMEELDYVLAGDRPVDYFLLSPEEFDQYAKSDKLFKNKDNPNDPYYTYRGIRIVISK